MNNYIKVCQENKNELMKAWFKNSKLLKLLEQRNIQKEEFVKNYGLSLLSYYISSIKNDNSNDTRIVENFISYLYIHNLDFKELLLIFSALKNTLIEFAYEVNENSLELYKKIQIIYDESFIELFEKVNKKINNTDEIIDDYVLLSRTNTKGIILSCSNAFCKISGYSKDELIGTSHNIVRHPDMKKEFFDNLWNTLRAKKVFKGEIKNLKKDGSYYWVDVIISPVYDLDGRVIAYDAIRQDITSKKDFENQRNILIEQSKSAAMGEMISMIAHQWRQPLQAVSVLIQKLPLTKMIDGEITDEVLDGVVEQVGFQLEYMSKTIDDFRDFFKPNKEKELVNINDIVNKAVDFLAYSIKIDMVNLQVKSLDEECTISIHFNEMVQALINLIKNSKDALSEKKIENRKINIEIQKDDKYVYIKISDNAQGINEEILNRIFEPYFSTKTKKNGTGLGLYMTKTIVEQHCNGEISVKNVQDGALFEIKLPL